MIPAGSLSYRESPDHLRRHRYSFWIDRPSTVSGVKGLAPVADVRNVGPDSERFALLFSLAPDLAEALRDCVAALCNPANGHGFAPVPALEEARRLLELLDAS